MLRPAAPKRGRFATAQTAEDPFANSTGALSLELESHRALTFVPIQVDLVAVQPPRQEPFIGQVLNVDSAASSRCPTGKTPWRSSASIPAALIVFQGRPGPRLAARLKTSSG